jgi:peptide/nickel transport system substrate-binding protein
MAAEIEQKLTTANIADPKTFNLLVSDEASSGAIVGELFEGLTNTNPKTNMVEPFLAKSWEVSEDGKVWTFHLREDVRWNDGVKFTAKDVKFTFDAIYDEKVPNSLKDIFTIDGKKIQVEVIGDYTVKFTLPSPFAPFLRSVGINIYPEHILGESLKNGTFTSQWGINTPPNKIVGLGRYKLLEYVPAQYAKLARNPYYWQKDDQGSALPYLNEDITLIVQNLDNAFFKFKEGDTDIYSPRGEDVEDLKKNQQTLRITVKEIGITTSTEFVMFNRNPRRYIKDGKIDPKMNWFTDKNFLKALAHTIDKEGIIISLMNGYGAPAVSYISESIPIYSNKALKDYEYDPDLATEMLEKAGYQDRNGDGVREDKDGNKIEFDLYTNSGNTVREKTCVILKEDWEKKLNLKVNYKPLEFNSLVEKLVNNFEWDAILMGFGGGAGDPHFGANIYKSSGKLHAWNPRQEKPATAWEAEVDQLVEAGVKELNEEKRAQIYQRIQEIFHEELPVLLTVRAKAFTAYKNKVKNYEPTILGIYRPELIRIEP